MVRAQEAYVRWSPQHFGTQAYLINRAGQQKLMALFLKDDHEFLGGRLLPEERDWAGHIWRFGPISAICLGDPGFHFLEGALDRAPQNFGGRGLGKGAQLRAPLISCYELLRRRRRNFFF